MKKRLIVITICMSIFLSGCSNSLSNKEMSETSVENEFAEEYEDVIDDEENDENEATNFLTGTAWEANGGSYLIFNDKNTYVWYQEKDVNDDNYYSGNYEVYIGENALEYITEDLSDYGVTEEELLNVIDNKDDYSIDNLVCITRTINYAFIDGKEAEYDDSQVSWFGFLLDNGDYLDVANMNTGSYYGFTKDESYSTSKNIQNDVTNSDIKDDEKSEYTGIEEDDSDTGNISNSIFTQISINGKWYSFPMDYSILTESGWTPEDEGEYESFLVMKNSKYENVDLYVYSAYTGNKLTSADIIENGVYGIAISDSDNDTNVPSFCIGSKEDGITFGATKEEVIEVFGEPYSSYRSGDIESVYYNGEDEYSGEWYSLSLSFNNAELFDIDIQIY